ncbi:hypothetical protein GYMLUDRAFT_39305 [Collybiopsis luxurians FD-317 M1]|nr:hypothetical protein GYMLUDRAFT_39305 [Collybiopsis luxurians FD-317 M1]
MALQTETSSSSSTSTSTSTSASATNTDNNQGSSGNLFDVSGSQPLILVFLAVGLFSAISIAILGWRRAYYVRSGMGVGHLHDANGEDAQNAGVGAKDRPKLWDLWTTTTVNPVPVPEVGQSRMEVEVEGISHGSESDHTQGRRGENSWANIMVSLLYSYAD